MLLSSLQFGATLAYSPRGTTEPSGRSATFVRALKQNKRLGIQGGITSARFLATRMAERVHELPFAEHFSADAVLVPMPRAGLRRKGALWPALEIAEALVECGFCADVRILLKRTTALRKAATAAAQDRPTALQHFDSIAVDAAITHPSLVLVDDVVTRGATMLGAASRLHARSPGVKIFGFAAARTISDREITEVFDPVVGVIELRKGQTFRVP